MPAQGFGVLDLIGGQPDETAQHHDVLLVSAVLPDSRGNHGDGTHQIQRDGEGFRAQLTTDSVGDPQIKSAVGGSDFLVWFYDCQDGKDCESIQFSVGFNTPSGLDLAVANEWNQKNRYANVHLDDERDPYIQMDIATLGGMSPELFAENLRLWENILERFKKHIDW